MYTFGSIGAGNMGGAVIKGAVESGLCDASRVAVYELSPERQSECRAAGFAIVGSERELYENCEYLLVAVKPQNIDALFDKLKGASGSPVIITVVAGLSIGGIKSALPGAKVVRVMPNTPMLVGCGAASLAKGEGVSDAQYAAVRGIFETCGEAWDVPEDMFNQALAIGSSSPAFIYYLIDAFAKWADMRGLDYATALPMAAKAFEGAVKMIQRGEKAPQQLIRDVCSPGGTTIEGMKSLEMNQVDKLLGMAAEASYNRAIQLSK